MVVRSAVTFALHTFFLFAASVSFILLLCARFVQEAHSKWWASAAGADSAAQHTFLPGCELTSGSAEGQCNPTCLAHK